MARCTLALVASSGNLLADNLQLILAKGDKARYADINEILQSCYGLVHTIKKYGRSAVEFTHYSVAEYTKTHWSARFPETPSYYNLTFEYSSSILHMDNLLPDEEILSVWMVAGKESVLEGQVDGVFSLLSTFRMESILPEIYDSFEFVRKWFDFSNAVIVWISQAAHDDKYFNLAAAGVVHMSHVDYGLEKIWLKVSDRYKKKLAGKPVRSALRMRMAQMWEHEQLLGEMQNQAELCELKEQLQVRRQKLVESLGDSVETVEDLALADYPDL
ncbi:hypothetical protein BT96DRAFT_120163 [Gymnopus androsaceus JB14]|uniref:Uncharacterized protein n=1 Tax=Gymnopus androsaceus JB14 TaxID=1447944 RepID=A0A6A4GC05_9AGAR|nr:hypothetical protein BT96DRAFT_120163 [Gymnopus androsaceus JB14]